MVIFQGYENPDAAPPPEAQNNNNNNNNNNNGAQSSVQPVAMGPGNPEYDKMALANTENRKAPEGKDNDSLIESSESKDGQKESTYTTDANGKINVTVFVTINGTLADLKKQRAQIRNSSTELNSITTPISSLPESDSGLSTSPLSVHRFSGNTGDVVGDTRSKRCCVIQ